MRLSIAPLAQLDLDEIWEFLAVQSGSVEIADRVLDSLGRTIHLLLRSPYAGRDRAGDLRVGLRSIPSGRFAIFYRVDSGVVRVIRVLHGGRDLMAIFAATFPGE